MRRHQDNRPPTRSRASSNAWIAIIASLTVTGSAAQAQKVYYESFDSLPLGPNVEEGLVGQNVWTEVPPAGWVLDDSQVPGIGTELNGITEWAGWSFANKDWWVQTAGNQRRAEFAYGQRTVMISDPDEWDDAGHAPGLLNEWATSGPIAVTGAVENTLVMTIDSSWRPEAFDDGAPNFPIDPETGRPINHQNGVIYLKAADGTETEILNFDSDTASPNFHADNQFINEHVVIPLNNAAGNSSFSLKFAMLTAANDWWWAVDNIAIGVPPFVSGVTNDGVSFSARITEALEKTVDESSITAELDGQAVVGATVERDQQEGKPSLVWVTVNQAPVVFAPNSKHVVKLKYTTGEGKSVEDSVDFYAPGYVTASATTKTVLASITETSWLSVDESKAITLVLDGKPIVASSLTRVDNAEPAYDVINLVYDNPELFDSGSGHTLKVTFTTATGQVLEETVTFKSPVYTTLPAAFATDPGTGVDAGMRWRTHQLATGRATALSEVERQLLGELGESIHNPDGQGEDGYFLIDFVNFDQRPGPAGNFREGVDEPQNVPDVLMPGISGPGDNIAGEALTFLEFTAAGLYQMVVNSDDGFRVSAGPSSNPTQLTLSQFDGGRGAADSVFYFRVDKVGVYPFRLLWFEGGGDASVEWFTVNADGSRALVGGTQPGSVSAFRQRTEAPAGGIQSIARQADGKVTITFSGTLKSATTVTGPYEAVQGAVSPLSVTPGDSQRFYRAE
ncbi:MAG: hypothetical protein JNN07_02330 [Verrucomicrobiales bacterium]|nr:hypothetical protein [Verrucomicrobiales bacterium]